MGDGITAASFFKRSNATDSESVHQYMLRKERRKERAVYVLYNLLLLHMRRRRRRRETKWLVRGTVGAVCTSMYVVLYFLLQYVLVQSIFRFFLSLFFYEVFKEANAI